MFGLYFENAADLFWFIGILLLVEYVVMLGMWRIIKMGFEPRRKWLLEEREKQEKEM